MRIGVREFDMDAHTYVMGILNVTPDSFSDGGRHATTEEALREVERQIRDGVDVVDIGGESTRPGHEQVSEQEEINRILPVIRAIRRRWDVPLSVDTYKAKVAEAALEAGADMVNDVWGLRYDGGMASVAKRYDAPICLMHNRNDRNYGDFLPDVMADLEGSVRMAEEAGIDRGKLMVDPGVGFAKDYGQNLLVLAHLERFHTLGLPILLGASRKSVIGQTLNLPVTDREEGTLATTVMAVMAGCGFVRVHDVGKNVRAIAMTEAVKGCR